MKSFYLTISIILTIALLIVAFENVGANCDSISFLFFKIKINPAFIVLGVSGAGILTGAFYHAFLARVFDSPDDEEEEF